MITKAEDYLNLLLDVDEEEDYDDNESFYLPSSPVVRSEKKVGRNDPCPCNSGKKYKKCCGAA